MTFKKVALLCILIFSGTFLHAQSHLRISTITGFPFYPPDTAFEANTYDSIRISIVNTGTAVFSDFIDVFLMDSTGIDTLYSDVSSTMILPGDSVIRQRSGFHFSPFNFADGDNIIVVWPAARSNHAAGDSLTNQVFFYSLATGIENIDSKPVILYPNPSAKFIAFKKPEEIIIKQVRITDPSGKEVYCCSDWQQFISVEEWRQGIYVIEIVQANGSKQLIKFLKN